MKRSLLVALVIGTLLVFIHHYGSLAAGRVGEAVQIVVTYRVPCSVATFSTGKRPS